MPALLDAFLDGSIVFSFDRSGYRRHAAGFHTADLEVDLSGKVCLVTGANSGIGRAAALELARRGADVHLLCRNVERGETAASAIRAAAPKGRARVDVLDVSSLASIRAFVKRLRAPRVDVLVNNAGVLPERYLETRERLELTLATNLAGPFLLTELLLPRLQAAGDPRVVNVASGGMYTQKLRVADLAASPRRFDGVVQYARTKRALVVLTELWAERNPRVTFASMHPGWADTPAVRTSLPRFHAVTRTILRTPEEGADTVVWLAASPTVPGKSGLFWFDRRPAPTHMTPLTREDEAERAALWTALGRWTTEAT